MVLASFGHDLHHAIRLIRKMPVLAAVVVGSIAIGVGVNTTVFSWIQSRVLTPIAGVARGSAFYLIEARGEGGSYPSLSWLEYRDLTERLPAFRDVIAFRMAPLNIGASDWSERTYGLLVSGNYFSALGLAAEAGRLVGPEDTAHVGAAPVVVVSHRFWQSRLAGTRDVVGHSLRVNDQVLTIVGVAPADFQGTVMGLTFDLWIPATAAPLIAEGTRELEDRGFRDYMALGDLKPGVSRATAQRDLDAVMRELAQTYPETNATIGADVLPQWQSPRGPQRSLMAALVMLQGVMLLVLAVAAGNTTNLVLARASVRRQEVGVMLALGAGRWRIVRLVLAESLLLAILGAVLGALLAVWGTDALRAVPLPTPGGLELTFFTRVDGVSLAFATALGLLSGLVIGLPPALQLAGTDPHASLRAGGAAPRRGVMRDVLLALEVALAMVVLVVAAMFLRSFRDTRTTDPGFRRDGVLLATYDLRGRNRSIAPAASAEFAARLIDRLSHVPAIESVALGTSVPLDIHGMPSRTFSIDGRARPDGSPDEALTTTVSPGYFRTMGIAMVQGVDFADLRDPAAPPQAIVNEAFARQFVPRSPGSDVGSPGSSDPGLALGRRIESGGRTYVVVGVVHDSLYAAFGERPTPFIYLSLRDRPSAMVEIHVRARGGSEKALAADLREAMRELDPTLPIYNIRTLNEHVESNLVFRRIPARMFAVLGPLLLALVAVGIYAVVAYAVAQRRREIGTRIALGATAGRVARGLVRDTLRVVVLGMSGGGVVALMIDPGALAGRASDLWLLGGVSALFLAAAVLASWMPAWRAARIDPIVVLKQD